MRGLPPLERHLLTTWVVGELRPAADTATLVSLAEAGRLTRSDGGDNWVWHQTQFAHLALRVCPVGEL